MKITKFNKINVEIFQNLIIFLTCNNNLTLYIFLIASILVIKSTNIRNSMNYYEDKYRNILRKIRILL